MVLKLGLCQLFLKLIDPDPWEQAHFYSFHAFDLIVEIDANFLCLAFGAGGADPIGRSHLLSLFCLLL